MLYTLKYKNRYCTHIVHDIFFSRSIIIQVREDVQSSTLTGMVVLFVCLQSPSMRMRDCPFDTHNSCICYVCYHPILVCVSLVFFSPCFLPSTPYYTIFFCVLFLVHYCFIVFGVFKVFVDSQGLSPGVTGREWEGMLLWV